MAETITIQSSVLHGIKDLRTETRTLPPPEPQELQIAIASTGLCGSDLHYYNHYRNGDILVREPLSLGHESSGIITALGSEISSQFPHFSIGDKVALEVGIPCSKSACEYCGQGRYNICKELRFRSSGKSFPHFQGTLQQRINHPAKWCYKLPEEVELDFGALLEPLGVALHAFRRSGLSGAGAGSQKKIVVFGAGAVGLLVAAVVKLKGAGKIVIVDVDAGRLDFAVEKGFADAKYKVEPKRGSDIDENLKIAKETAESIGMIDGLGEVDVVFECTGVPSCVQAGIYSTKAGGKLMLVGMGHPIQTLPLGAAALREVDILGVFRYANTYPESINMVQSAVENQKDPNVPDLRALVTHRFKGLDSIPQAFEMAAKTTDGSGNLVLKVVVDTLE